MVHVSPQYLAPHPLPLPERVVGVLDGADRAAARAGRPRRPGRGRSARTAAPPATIRRARSGAPRGRGCSRRRRGAAAASAPAAAWSGRTAVRSSAAMASSALLGGDVEHPQRRPRRGERPLHRDPVDGDERGPQDLVPAHDLVERGPQRLGRSPRRAATPWPGSCRPGCPVTAARRTRPAPAAATAVWAGPSARPDRRPGRRRGRGVWLAAGRGRPGSPARSSRMAAIAATVRARSRSARLTVTCSSAVSWAASRPTSSEVPPRAKKSSSAPTTGSPATIASHVCRQPRGA